MISAKAQRKSVRTYFRFILPLLVFQAALLRAQTNEKHGKDLSDDAIARYKADVFRPWETRCMPKGCILSLDVLRGESDDPPDASDINEYISISVAINREDSKPAYVMFQVTPYAQQDQGLFVAFTHSSMENGRGKLAIDSDGAVRLALSKCDHNVCIAVAPSGRAKDDETNLQIDLLDKFLHSTHLMMLYMSKGHAYRTMVLLSPFQKEYERVMREEIKTASKPSK